MIAITTCGYDTRAPFVLDNEPMSERETLTKNVKRVETLDGGCVIVGSEFSDIRRTVNIKASTSEDDAHELERLFRSELTLLFFLADGGAFTGVIKSFKGGAISEISVLLTGEA